MASKTTPDLCLPQPKAFGCSPQRGQGQEGAAACSRCHRRASAEQMRCQEGSACELPLVLRPGSDGLRTSTGWAQTSCLSVFSKHLASVSVL